MIGNKKLSTIRTELKAAAAAEGLNPIASLDRELRKMQKDKSHALKTRRSLEVLRGALAQLIEEKPTRPAVAKRPKRPKKAV